MSATVAELESRILELRRELAALRRTLPAEPVADHGLSGPDGAPLPLSRCFDGREDLLLVHNMGRGCPYCTLWADGFNGLAPELLSRCAVLLVSPDPPEVAQAFARERGWRMPVASDETRAFSAALGYWDGTHMTPGVSALHRDEQDRITRTGQAIFGPGDDFCAAWPLFDLLKDGAGDWHPRHRL